MSNKSANRITSLGLAIFIMLAVYSGITVFKIANLKPIKQATHVSDKVLNCLPDDMGIKSVLWLERSNTKEHVLMLHCEKHENVAFGLLERMKPTLINVPVMVD